MTTDTRVFKIHYSDGKTIRYGSRHAVVSRVNAQFKNYTNTSAKFPFGRPVKIEATDKDALTGWTDATAEFEYLKGWGNG